MAITGRKITAKTGVYGVIGHPIRHSLSPEIHNEWFAQAGLDNVYVAWDFFGKNTKKYIKNLWQFGVKGLNITAPHKEVAFEAAGSSSPLSSKLQASNILSRSETGWYADNVDGEGFIWALQHFLDKEIETVLKDSNIAIIGAGGSSRSILLALKAQLPDAQLTLYNRTKSRAEQMLQLLELKSHVEIRDFDAVEEEEFNLVISTLPAQAQSVCFDLVENWTIGQGIYDISYNANADEWQRFCDRKKVNFENGLSMLVGQAAKSFQIWTGIEPDPIHMLEKLERIT